MGVEGVEVDCIYPYLQVRQQTDLSCFQSLARVSVCPSYLKAKAKASPNRQACPVSTRRLLLPPLLATELDLTTFTCRRSTSQSFTMFTCCRLSPAALAFCPQSLISSFEDIISSTIAQVAVALEMKQLRRQNWRLVTKPEKQLNAPGMGYAWQMSFLDLWSLCLKIREAHLPRIAHSRGV